MTVSRFFSPATEVCSDAAKAVFLKQIQTAVPQVLSIESETCFYVQHGRDLKQDEMDLLLWLLSDASSAEKARAHSFLQDGQVVEVGPRLSFTTPFSSNAVAICIACGLDAVDRIEASRRYRLVASSLLNKKELALVADAVHDRMTECVYDEPIQTFRVDKKPEPVFSIPVMKKGREALVHINREMGLAFDDWDIDFYTSLFRDKVGRDPTNVECFDMAQSNSEHSRHWFFKGKIYIDGKEVPRTLMDVVASTLEANPSNSLVAFRDNSSVIRGGVCHTLLPLTPTVSSRYQEKDVEYHPLFTAETHNFPTGVCPFPGAATGTGGRIRDTHATGRGGNVIAGTAGYSVGSLHIQGYDLPWEDPSLSYADNLASPLKIAIDASNGASEYGNKFGEPIVQGFMRSFGLQLPDRGERREYIKPIMFTGGVGQVDSLHTEKEKPAVGMCMVKLGGPAYRIGMGGGAASSMVQGQNRSDLDFNAVQRGDPEMEQKVNRVIRACIELGSANPIVSIHDQGAGGSANVLKELVEPEGGRVEIRSFHIGDETMSVLELWGAEYQEQDALLIRKEDVSIFQQICQRENCLFAVVGHVTGDGKIVVFDSIDNSTPVDLDLETVLGKMPQKKFHFESTQPTLTPLNIPKDIGVLNALDRVLRLPSVASKRWLTSKVDRSVSGLIAQQQCVGPLHTPLADVAVTAQSVLGNKGIAIAIGEQPVKGLVSNACMGRMSVGEALTNMIWAPIPSLEHIKVSGNWMWAAKLPGEGAGLYEAACAMAECMISLGVGVDGGKDSLSMAAGVDGQTVKAPGTLVISTYAPCVDITQVVTPDLKGGDSSSLLFIHLGGGRTRMGGSALAHCYGQIGEESPDMDDTRLFKRAFSGVQELVKSGKVLAGHDISDGGLITTLLEMAFAGDRGIDVNVPAAGSGGDHPVLYTLFAEELGMVIEVDDNLLSEVHAALGTFDIPCAHIGKTTVERSVCVQVNGNTVLHEKLSVLRDMWEATSFQLDCQQTDPECVAEEKALLSTRTGLSFRISFVPEFTPSSVLNNPTKHKVAIVRCEGSNGDREMAAAFHLAGFEVHDVMMTDLIDERVILSSFRGLAFVGGFSYSDTLGAAKGWAATIKHHSKVYKQFQDFYARKDTFSLGVCNGCQLMALLGWVPGTHVDESKQPRFVHNSCGRYQSRFVAVQIQQSRAVMFRGMEKSVLGAWVNHGEGRAYFPDTTILQRVEDGALVPLRYVDDDHKPTQKYPMNPNGSTAGIAALCSEDGRHLAMMPHSERLVVSWQWPYWPSEWSKHMASPWLRMFQNARAWCDA